MHHQPHKTVSRDNDNDLLIIGTNAEYPPFATIENDEITGFDIDLIKEIAQRLHKTIKLKDMPFDTLIPEMQLGHITVIAAGMTATPEREKQMFFSVPYLEQDPLVAITQDSNMIIHSVDDLTNKRIVVNEGYTADSYLSQYPHLTIERLATPAEAILALKSGRADIFVAAHSSVQPFLRQQQAQKFATHTLEGVGDSYALAISKKDPELLDAINKSIKELLQDGTIEQLKKKWSMQ